MKTNNITISLFQLPEEAQTMDDGKVTTFPFQTEIVNLMSLISKINFNKEIFLEELVQNSSTALDQLNDESSIDSSKLDLAEDLVIRIRTDRDNNTLTIFDNGIGMTKADLVNLGTITKFKTIDFLEGLCSCDDVSQFSLGFYSAYLIAHKVVVHTKHDNDKDYIWESSADGFFTVKPATGIK